MWKTPIWRRPSRTGSRPLTCDWDSLIEELGAPSVSSATIYDVTHEAAFDYYGNEIDLDTAVQRIEENLGLYFSEQQ